MKSIVNKITSNVLVKNLIDFFKLVSKSKVSAFAVQGAYYVFASLVPFLILILTILRFTPFDMKFASQQIVNGIPEYFQGFALGVVDQIYNNSSLAMSFSILTLIWTASKGIYVIVDGFNSIYNTTKKTSYIKDLLYSLLYTVIFVLAVPVLIIVTVFGQAIIDFLIKYIPIINRFQNTIVIGKALGSTAIIFLLLFVMYKFMPNKKLKVKDIFVGTIISTIAWQIFTYAFSLYVNISLSKASIYGSMNIILILLFWLYCIYFIIFAGAQINAMMNNKRCFGNVMGIVHENSDEVNLIFNKKNDGK